MSDLISNYLNGCQQMTKVATCRKSQEKIQQNSPKNVSLLLSNIEDPKLSMRSRFEKLPFSLYSDKNLKKVQKYSHLASYSGYISLSPFHSDGLFHTY